MLVPFPPRADIRRQKGPFQTLEPRRNSVTGELGERIGPRRVSCPIGGMKSKEDGETGFPRLLPPRCRQRHGLGGPYGPTPSPGLPYSAPHHPAWGRNDRQLRRSSILIFPVPRELEFPELGIFEEDIEGRRPCDN